MIKVSIIVPIYNVEKYLDRCVTSLINQTLKDIEIILVDDGSSDNCPSLCDEWQKKDNRIKVVHKQNGGIGSARNAGLEIAKGKYIAFVDSDDYVELDAYETMVYEIEKNECDICVGFWRYVYDKTGISIDHREHYRGILGIYSSIDFEKFTYKNPYLNVIVCAMWNKLYKSSIFNYIKFTSKFSEDEEINDLINSKDYKVCFIDKNIYYYCQNPTSITNQKFNIKRFDILDILANRHDLYREDTYIMRETERNYCNLFVDYFYKAKNNNVFINKKYFKFYRNFYFSSLKHNYCNIKFYLRNFVFMISPKIYKFIIDIKSK